MSRGTFVQILPRVYAGTHVRHPGCRCCGRGGCGVAAAGIVGYADGERFAPLPLECEAVPGALRVLGPLAPPVGVRDGAVPGG